MKQQGVTTFLRQVNNRRRFNLFLFLKLPAAYLCGVRLREVTEDHAVATVPFRWISQNPFRSIYFACLAMAAELSTGILAMAFLNGRKPRVSMLVVRMEADFRKKGTGLVSFTCRDGEGFRTAVDQASATGESVQFTASAIGHNASGEVVAEFRFTWSFKSKI
jgi:hypothetical protein